MKKLLLTICTALPLIASAQIPLGYYDDASGLSGQPLRVALRNIIRPHTELAYGDLWTAYHTTDVKASGKLWDMYSDKPGGTPAYEYTIGSDQCGSAGASGEGGCYNREHTWPQSKFGSLPPMQTDLWIVYPTDYWVNNRRGNMPYGLAGSPITDTFTNGSRIGDNTYAGSPSGDCYEPIDSFKGDIARTYFYVTTCYWADSAVFTNWEMASRVTLKPWAIEMLMAWHHADPVSQKEINRNNKAYLLQNNRNPFIDHPEYADCIWGTTGCTTGIPATAAAQQLLTAWHSTTTGNLQLSWSLEGPGGAIAVYNMDGSQLYSQPIATTGRGTATADVHNWAPGIYIVRMVTATATTTTRVLVQ